MKRLLLVLIAALCLMVPLASCQQKVIGGVTTFVQDSPADPTASPPTPAFGTRNCALTAAAKSCWASNTGVDGAVTTGYMTATARANLTVVNSSVAIRDDGIYTCTGTCLYGGTRFVTFASGDLHSMIGYRINGCVAVQTSGAVIANSEIVTDANVCKGADGADTGTAILSNGQQGHGADGLFVMYTTIRTEHPAVGTDGNCIDVHDAHLWSVDVSSCANNIWAKGGTQLWDSYVHDSMVPAGSNEHVDSIQSESPGAGGLEVQHSWIGIGVGPAYFGPTGGYTEAIRAADAWGVGTSIVVNESYLEGTANTLSGSGGKAFGAPYCLPLGACTSFWSKVVFTNNAVSINTNLNTFGPLIGQPQFEGSSLAKVGTAPIYRWSGNYVPETSTAIACPEAASTAVVSCSQN